MEYVWWWPFQGAGKCAVSASGRSVGKSPSGLRNNPVRTQLIPVRKDLNPEREGGVQHAGSKASQGVTATERRCQRKLCTVKAILLES